MPNQLTRFDHYYLGHAILDSEHKAIYDALEAMWKTIPPDLIPEQMEVARVACHLHFEHEEAMMREMDYPFIQSHLEIHEATVGKFFEVIDHPTTENLKLLVDDLLDHIDWYDRPFAAFLKVAELTPQRCDDKCSHSLHS